MNLQSKFLKLFCCDKPLVHFILLLLLFIKAFKAHYINKCIIIKLKHFLILTKLNMYFILRKINLRQKFINGKPQGCVC
jgi:hypothetical protein